MPDCPKCGYALGPFDTTCPRCARLGVSGGRQEASSGQQEIDELLSAAKELSGAPDSPTPRKQPASQTRAPASSRRQVVLGAIAVAAILIGGLFLIAQIRHSGLRSNPLSEEASPSDAVNLHHPVAPTSPKASPSGQPSAQAPAAAEQQADDESQDLLRRCPFDLHVGQEVAVRSPARPTDLRVSIKEGQLESAESGGWRLQGVGGQLLQIDQQHSGDALSGNLVLRFLWKDQPFEIYQNGQPVGSFRNTEEYWQAQQ